MLGTVGDMITQTHKAAPILVPALTRQYFTAQEKSQFFLEKSHLSPDGFGVSLKHTHCTYENTLHFFEV